MTKEIPAIESAVINIGTAASDCGSARDAWIESNWADAVMWINNAISQLESARAKIEAHTENASLSIPDGEPGYAPGDCSAERLDARITECLSLGGFFNPEQMEHDKVRDLLIDCRNHFRQNKGLSNNKGGEG